MEGVRTSALSTMKGVETIKLRDVLSRIGLDIESTMSSTSIPDDSRLFPRLYDNCWIETQVQICRFPTTS